MTNFKLTIKKITKNNYFRRGFYSWLLMISIQISVLIIKWPQLPPAVPLFYSYPWGEKQLAPPQELIIFPASTMVFALINGLLATLAYPKNTLIAAIFLIASLFVNLIATIGLLKIVYLIT